MPFFHFHFHDGTARQDDEIGLELPDVEAAYLQAVAAARDMGGHLMGGEGLNPALCSFEITTPDGIHLFSIEFSDLIDGGKPRTPTPDHATARLKLVLESTHKRALAAKTEMANSLSQTRATLADSHALLSRLSTFERRRPATDAS